MCDVPEPPCAHAQVPTGSRGWQRFPGWCVHVGVMRPAMTASRGAGVAVSGLEAGRQRAGRSPTQERRLQPLVRAPLFHRTPLTKHKFKVRILTISSVCVNERVNGLCPHRRRSAAPSDPPTHRPAAFYLQSWRWSLLGSVSLSSRCPCRLAASPGMLWSSGKPQLRPAAHSVLSDQQVFPSQSHPSSKHQIFSPKCQASS